MKWALILGGLLVAVALTIVTIGALLPRDHVATLSARIAAPPAMVWSAITQPEAFASWRSGVSKVEVLAPVASGASWREHTSNGTLTMVVDSAEPPRRLVTRIADKNLPFGGQWEFDIAADGADASRVSITERGWVSNPVFRFVSRFVMGHTASLDAYLRSLGKHFGSEPTPTVIASAGVSHGL